MQLTFSKNFQTLYDLDVAAFENTWSLAQWRAEVENSSATNLLLEDKNGRVGFISLLEAGDDIEIKKIAITPARRNQGLGSTLLSKVHQFIAAKKKHRILLEVGVSNYSALSLYQRFQYQAYAIRPHYYSANEDALCLFKKI